MIIQYHKPIICQDTSACAADILSRLETALSLKLHAETETETGMEGSVSIYHIQRDHTITVEVYTTTRDRLKEPSTIPTESQVINVILSEEIKLTEEQDTAKPKGILNRIKSLLTS